MMGSTKSTCYLFYQTFGTGFYKKDICTNHISKKLIKGYYCPVDTTTIQFAHVTHLLCTHYCVSVFQCSVLPYHVDKSMCLMHREVCTEMVKWQGTCAEFNYPVRATRTRMFSWLPYQGSIPDGEQFVHMEGTHVFILVRLHHRKEILTGRFLKRKGQVKTVSLVNGPMSIKEVADSAMEFLVVSDICSVAWVPYVTGNPLPSRAVAGGRKGNGEPLFVASLWTTYSNMKQKYSFGHYDPESGLGYTYHGGVRANSSMDIMVENWQWSPT